MSLSVSLSVSPLSVSRSYARHLNQPGNDYFWIDIDKGESLCPLCKSISNTLLPVADVAPSRSPSEMDVDAEPSTGPAEALRSAWAALQASRERESAIATADTAQAAVDGRFLDFLLANAFFCTSSAAAVADIATADGGSFGFREVDGWLHGRMRSVRGLALVAQAAAHGLVQHVTKALRFPAVPVADGISFAPAPQAVESHGDLLALRQLLALLQRAPQTLRTDATDAFDVGVALPLFAQLWGRELLQREAPTLGASAAACIVRRFDELGRWAKLASALPWPSLHSAAFPDDASPLHVLLQLQRAYDTGGLSGAATSSAPLPVATWHFLSRPLLLSDLTVTLVSSAALVARSEPLRAEVFRRLLLAQLAQTLWDLGAAGDGSAEASSPLSKRPKLTHAEAATDGLERLGERLQRLQRLLPASRDTRAAGLADERSVARHVLSAAVVFVECMLRLDAALQGKSVAELRVAADDDPDLVLVPAAPASDAVPFGAACYTAASVCDYVDSVLRTLLRLPTLDELLVDETDCARWLALWSREAEAFLGCSAANRVEEDVAADVAPKDAAVAVAVVDAASGGARVEVEAPATPPTGDAAAAPAPPAPPAATFLDAEDDFEDLDALNDLEAATFADDAPRAADGDREAGSVNILREATMENLRIFLRTLPVADINTAVQQLVRESRALNAELTTVTADVAQIEVRLGIRAATARPTDERPPPEPQPDAVGDGREADDGGNGEAERGAARTGDDVAAAGATTWAQTARHNAELNESLTQLRSRRGALVRSITRNMGLLMMLMAANDNNISAQQILQGDINIQLAPQPGQRGRLDPNVVFPTGEPLPASLFSCLRRCSNRCPVV